jgi:flagellin-like protein
MSDSHERAERGMTPVVGIVLLVAVTLLLAATVAAFALGIQDDQRSDRVPTVAIDFEYNTNGGTNDTLTVVHKSGQAVDTSRIDVVIGGAKCGGGSPDGRYSASDWTADTRLTAGGTFTIDGSMACSSGDLDLSGASVQVVWNPKNGGSSTTLRRWHGPR